MVLLRGLGDGLLHVLAGADRVLFLLLDGGALPGVVVLGGLPDDFSGLVRRVVHRGAVLPQADRQRGQQPLPERLVRLGIVQTHGLGFLVFGVAAGPKSGDVLLVQLLRVVALGLLPAALVLPR